MIPPHNLHNMHKHHYYILEQFQVRVVDSSLLTSELRGLSPKKGSLSFLLQLCSFSLSLAAILALVLAIS